jgi:hypothetical protein
MGEFVAVSAVRTGNLDAVGEAALDFFRTHSCAAEQIPATGRAQDAADLRIYGPGDGWTVILWPQPFAELAAAEFVSRRLGTLVSSISLYDGDYWRHVLFRDGEVLDRFGNVPDYFAENEQDAARLRDKFGGQPAVVADAVGCPPERLAPYLVRADLDEDTDPWIFVEFWRQFGPRYPEDLTEDRIRIRLAPDGLDKLPYGDGDL